MAKGSKHGFESWLKTGKGIRVLKGFMANQSDEYKKNCLWWTYYAGAASGEISATREVALIFKELKGRKTIPVSLQRRIQYVLDHPEDYTIESMHK